MYSWLHHSGGGEGPQEAGELADDHIRARKDEESKHPKTSLLTRYQPMQKVGPFREDLQGESQV